MKLSKNKVAPAAPDLTPEASLKTLVENRTIYNLESCELNLFETYQASELVPLRFNDLVVTSMLRGKKIMHLFGQPGFEYLPGESVIIPPNALMEIDFPEAQEQNPTQCLALAIDSHKIDSTLAFLNEKYPKDSRNDFWQLDMRNYFFYNHEELAATINKLIQVCQSTTITKDIMADLTLQELLIRLIQSQTLQALDTQGVAEKSPVLSQVITLIRKHIGDRIDIKTIAKEAGLSQASLYRLVKRELGISPVELVLSEKIKLAKQLLKDHRIYVKNVSFEAGFEDCNYFIRVFKHFEGITPRQYQQLQNKDLHQS
ncbi:MAG: AraC family transcriptional regulator [Bacteroidia bacterium]|nr:AraC family transcriptional regulator [Bacteroidia bacterium]